MKSEAIVRRQGKGWTAALGGVLFFSLASCAPAVQGGVPAGPSGDRQADPRVGLSAGWLDAGEAASNVELLANRNRPEGFFNPANPVDGDFSNTDLAFSGNHVFVGNYHGFTVYDISDPRSPRLRTSVVCPGGQGDISVHDNLLFLSVEQTRGRVDCGVQGVADTVSAERFRGVRIFDISNLDNPRQVAAVQTCRGSHTHTLVSDPRDAANLYVYVSGTSVARPAQELAGCVDVRSPDDPNTSYWSIAVIQVPLAAPQQARVVSEPRVFADAQTGSIAGLWQGGDHGPGTQRTSQTNQCHDITAYPEIGLAAGACSGNGILFDISNPANPVRIHEVEDPNFAYWHSATFSNDGSTVIFTDEWGGGRGARCHATDAEEWGANAIFNIVDRKMQFASYYKLPAAQTATENCVAHNGSLVPVPGRDIKAQAWYQGGLSVFDFTDAANPVEIAFFDRGPVSATELTTGGYWSTYWYNGNIYGSEIARGLDVFQLTPSEHLSQNEIEAARLVQFEQFNPQNQPMIVWPASFAVSRAYLDQLGRNNGLPQARLTGVRGELDRAERMNGAQRSAALTQLATQLDADASGAGDPDRVRALAASIRKLADA
ncbi:hypothetical protein BH23GEM3_BH23GEM3_12990 [soil metagenome]